MALRIPQPAGELSRERIGGYELLRRLGAGGMAEILLCHDAEKQLVVLKRLSTESIHDRSHVQMLIHEGRVATLLKHPNIVRVFAVDLDENGRCYIVMEYLEGWDLTEILETLQQARQLLPVPMVLRLVIDACAGLHAAHTAVRAEDGLPLSLIHRDLSPSNLFLTSSGFLKILDFGVAKTSLQLHRTDVGVLKGKPSYMSPEQLRSEEIDQRSDIFSLGVVLHEMLTGGRLFKRSSFLDLVRAVTQLPIPTPLRDGGLPPDLVCAAMRALERDRDLRYASAAAFAHDLSPIMDATGEHPTGGDVVRWINQVFEARRSTGFTDAQSCPHLAVPNLGQSRGSEGSVVIFPDQVEVTRLDLAPRGAFGKRLTQATQLLSAAGPLRRMQMIPGRRAAAAVVAACIIATIAGLWLTRSPKRETDPSVAEEAASVSVEPRPNPPADSTKPAIFNKKAEEPRLPAPTARENEPTPDAAVDAPRDAPSKRPRHAGRLGVRERPPPPPRAEPIKNVTGRLSLQVKPWADVIYQGRSLGPSPLVDHEFPAGRIELKLVNAERGLERVVSVEIPAGRAVRLSVTLE